MSQAALKYSPVQYRPEDASPVTAEDNGNVSGSLRQRPFALRAEKYDLPIRLQKESAQTSSRQGYKADAIPTASSLGAQIPMPKPLVVKRLPAVEQPRFVVLQKWEGVVLSVGNDMFIARLINQTDSGPDQEAEFSKDEIDKPDHPLMQPGAIFYWTLGYSDSPGGQRNRISSLRFRRLPAWNKSDIDTTKLEARSLLSRISWE
jgi:hypothetical protein